MIVVVAERQDPAFQIGAWRDRLDLDIQGSQMPPPPSDAARKSGIVQHPPHRSGALVAIEDPKCQFGGSQIGLVRCHRRDTP